MKTEPKEEPLMNRHEMAKALTALCRQGFIHLVWKEARTEYTWMVSAEGRLHADPELLERLEVER